MVKIDSHNQIIALTIRDRNGIIFDGPVSSLTSFNDKGEFDVLPLHANFISLIRENLFLRLPDDTVKKIPLQVGVLMVRENGIEVYLGLLH